MRLDLDQVNKQFNLEIELQIAAVSNIYFYYTTGANFEFFPPNSKLTVVEPNAFFEPFFYERQKKSIIKMEKFLLTTAEEMQEIEDNSMDVVVSTLVLCSVRNLQKTLKEIHRVLAPVHFVKD